MTQTINLDHLRELMYHFGATKVATFLGVDNQRDLIAWIDHSKTKIPTEQQIARLDIAYLQFDRVRQRKNSDMALTWFESHGISHCIRNDQFQEVRESATRYVAAELTPFLVNESHSVATKDKE